MSPNDQTIVDEPDDDQPEILDTPETPETPDEDAPEAPPEATVN
jgi:hypothetical protein